MNIKLVLGVGLGFVLGLAVGTKFGGPVLDSSEPIQPTSVEAPHHTLPSSPIDKPPAEVAQVLAPPRGEVPESSDSSESPRASGENSKGSGKTAVAKISERWEIGKFLDATQEEDFFSVLRDSKPIQTSFPAIDQLNGLFVGDVSLPDERWEMELEARLEIADQQLRGESRIVLSKNGKVFSSLDGKGTLNEYQRPPLGEGLVVRASPDSYFHLFYIPRRDIFVGHYYQMKRPGHYQARGRVWLERG